MILQIIHADIDQLIFLLCALHRRLIYILLRRRFHAVILLIFLPGNVGFKCLLRFNGTAEFPFFRKKFFISCDEIIAVLFNGIFFFPDLVF